MSMILKEIDLSFGQEGQKPNACDNIVQPHNLHFRVHMHCKPVPRTIVNNNSPDIIHLLIIISLNIWCNCKQRNFLLGMFRKSEINLRQSYVHRLPCLF